MATVVIDSGPIEAIYRLREVPQSKWLELVIKRSSFPTGAQCQRFIPLPRMDFEEVTFIVKQIRHLA